MHLMMKKYGDNCCSKFAGKCGKLTIQVTANNAYMRIYYREIDLNEPTNGFPSVFPEYCNFYSRKEKKTRKKENQFIPLNRNCQLLRTIFLKKKTKNVKINKHQQKNIIYKINNILFYVFK